MTQTLRHRKHSTRSRTRYRWDHTRGGQRVKLSVCFCFWFVEPGNISTMCNSIVYNYIKLMSSWCEGTWLIINVSSCFHFVRLPSVSDSDYIVTLDWYTYININLFGENKVIFITPALIIGDQRDPCLIFGLNSRYRQWNRVLWELKKVKTLECRNFGKYALYI